MSTTAIASTTQREPELLGQTVAVIGGSAGVGLAAAEIDAQSTTAFDATDFNLLERFFDGLPEPVDHALATGPGPYYAPLSDFDFDKARSKIEAHLLLPIQIARNAADKVRPGGTLLFRALRVAASRRRDSSSSPPDSWIHRCPHNFLEINSTSVATSFAPLFPSDAYSGRSTWPR